MLYQTDIVVMRFILFALLSVSAHADVQLDLFDCPKSFKQQLELHLTVPARKSFSQKGIVDDSEGIDFRLIDADDSSFFIKGDLEGDTINFHISMRTKDGKSKNLKGYDAFDKMMKYYSDRDVQSIKGNWGAMEQLRYNPSDKSFRIVKKDGQAVFSPSDNLDQFNEVMAELQEQSPLYEGDTYYAHILSDRLKYAASQTCTGKQAARHGYTDIVLGEINYKNNPTDGVSHITVKFVKPIRRRAEDGFRRSDDH